MSRRPPTHTCPTGRVGQQRSLRCCIIHVPWPRVPSSSVCSAGDTARTTSQQSFPRWRHPVSWRNPRLQVPVRDHSLRGRSAQRTWLNVKHHLHSLLPEWHDRVQPRQVEIVLDEVLLDFTEVFMAGQRAKPADPRQRAGRRRGCYTG